MILKQGGPHPSGNPGLVIGLLASGGGCGGGDVAGGGTAGGGAVSIQSGGASMASSGDVSIASSDGGASGVSGDVSLR